MSDLKRGPHLAWAVLCEAMVPSSDGTQIMLRGITDVVSADRRTGQPSAELACRLAIGFHAGDATGDHELEVVVQLPTGERTAIERVTLPMPERLPWYCSMHEILADVDRGGEHWVIVLLDGTEQTRLPLLVDIRTSEARRLDA